MDGFAGKLLMFFICHVEPKPTAEEMEFAIGMKRYYVNVMHFTEHREAAGGTLLLYLHQRSISSFNVAIITNTFLIWL